MCKLFCFCFQFPFLALSIILNRKGKDIHPCLVPDHKKKESIQSFIMKCNVSYRYFCECPSSVWGLSLVLFISQFFLWVCVDFCEEKKNLHLLRGSYSLSSFILSSLSFSFTLSLFPSLPPSFLYFLKLSSCLRKNNKLFSTTSSLTEGLFPAHSCVLIWFLLPKIVFITCWVVQSLKCSDSLQPHGLQHIRILCPLLSPRVCSSFYSSYYPPNGKQLTFQ